MEQCIRLLDPEPDKGLSDQMSLATYFELPHSSQVLLQMNLD